MCCIWQVTYSYCKIGYCLSTCILWLTGHQQCFATGTEDGSKAPWDPSGHGPLMWDTWSEVTILYRYCLQRDTKRGHKERLNYADEQEQQSITGAQTEFTQTKKLWSYVIPPSSVQQFTVTGCCMLETLTLRTVGKLADAIHPGTPSVSEVFCSIHLLHWPPHALTPTWYIS